MDEIKVPESDGKQTVQPTKLDLDVKVFPSQRDGNLLASANITLGGCFAVKGLRVMNGRNGPFVAMPDWKDSKGERHDICFPVTKDMREAINSAVMGEYHRTVERIATRGEQAMQKSSVLNTLNQKKSQVAEQPTAPKKNADRGER